MSDELNITDLLSACVQLNTAYTTIIENEGISYTEQALATDFYEQYGKSQGFDKMIINLLLQKERATYTILIGRLKNELQKNTRFYEDNKELLDHLDIDGLCRKIATVYDQSIEEQKQRTKKYSDELKRIEGSLDATAFNGSGQEEKDALFREKEYYMPLYREEQERLSGLYDYQRESHMKAQRIKQNRFSEIYRSYPASKIIFPAMTKIQNLIRWKRPKQCTPILIWA